VPRSPDIKSTSPGSQVRETRRMCEMEVQTVKHRAALALTAKNHEIQQFQVELEGILHAATRVPRAR